MASFRVVSVFLASAAIAACGGGSEPVGAATAPPPTTTPPAEGSGPDASTPPVTPSASYFPPAAGTWETITAAAAGFDQAKLDEVSTFVQQSNSTTFMVLYDGRILVEKYWGTATATTLKDVASAQKSVLSMLMGTLIANGILSLDDTVTSVLGEGWSNATVAQEAPITLRHILTMTSGLDASLGYAAPPGTAWLYNTDAYHRNGFVVAKKTGKTLVSTRAAPCSIPSASARRRGRHAVRPRTRRACSSTRST